ncbi:sulfatase-like hydrolase/transferase [Emcibacter sp.]|uniref:sulfatase-like hydrolase/transferase n=1 Tax=Emcibacter sp. TaxID=1979954 RepID=UPI002AA608D2|nr:sulfatase-like hydrolase/transferase [Emcibacter sp.]
MKFFKLIIVAFSMSVAALPVRAEELKTENVILITLDGVRWEEVFRGVDKKFFDQKDYNAYHKTHNDFKKTFDPGSPEKNRAAIFPFLWSTVARDGQLYGNRDKGSAASLTNPYHFSYPGYNEILTGLADPRIDSNDKVPNPNVNVLEWLNTQDGFKGKTAAFGSWDVFPYILNENRSGVPVNAGFEQMDGLDDNAKVAFLNELQKEVPSPWDTVRLDAFTFGFAFEYLKERKPKMLYISLGETDDFAHEGFYDQYVLAARRADDFISRIWNWVQSDKRYKDKTTLIITTDHGRGEALEAWKHHGRFEYTDENGEKKLSDFPGDTAIWMAVIGPDTPAGGEMQNVDDVYQNQVAATAVKFLGLTYVDSHPELEAGQPIKSMFK